MANYVIEHTVVGVHRLGDVVEFPAKEVEKLGIDIKRLLRLGAVREATESEGKSAVPYGTASEEMPAPFPAVPFSATTISPDPLRSDSPPTLPQAGVPDHTTEIKGTVSEKPKPARA